MEGMVCTHTNQRGSLRGSGRLRVAGSGSIWVHPVVPDHIQTKSKQTNKINVPLSQPLCPSWATSSSGNFCGPCVAHLKWHMEKHHTVLLEPHSLKTFLHCLIICLNPLQVLCCFGVFLLFFKIFFLQMIYKSLIWGKCTDSVETAELQELRIWPLRFQF